MTHLKIISRKFLQSDVTWKLHEPVSGTDASAP